LDYFWGRVLDSEFGNAYIGRGEAYMGLKQYDQALADLNRGIQLKPEGHAYYLRGNTYVMKCQYDRAIDDYTRAIQNPDERLISTYYASRSLAYELDDCLPEALADQQMAMNLSKDPLSRDAFFMRWLDLNSKQ
jgi:tetratricopeptide (TPR) repeat protein